mmetsp:Transcript_24732/g.30887  ORF Transcript_24732/g.30887 Transcript_24732/m.30887 type:complete len:248 (-) Transcript_24732:297-1040(-)
MDELGLVSLACRPLRLLQMLLHVRVHARCSWRVRHSPPAQRFYLVVLGGDCASAVDGALQARVWLHYLRLVHLLCVHLILLHLSRCHLLLPTLGVGCNFICVLRCNGDSLGLIVPEALHWLGHLVLHIHGDISTERVALQHLVLSTAADFLFDARRVDRLVALHGRDGDRLRLVKLFFCLHLRPLLLHRHLLLDASDLVAHVQCVVLHLLAHFEGAVRRLRVSLLNHLTHFDLSLREIHHFEVAVDV